MLEIGPWHLRFAVESRLELLLTGARGSRLPVGQAVLTRPAHADALLAVLPTAAPERDESHDRDDPFPPRIRLVS